MIRNILRDLVPSVALVIAAAAFSHSGIAAAAEVPIFVVDPSWPKVPAKWKLGDASGVAIDAKDNVWVIHRPRTLPANQAAMAAPPVMVFDPAGNFVKGWGGAANGYEWPEREHGIHIDYKGYVWIGGNNCPARALPGLLPHSDDQLLKFTQDGKFVLQVGQSNQSKGNADTKNFHEPADAVVYPKTNELFVADGYGNHRVMVMDADTGQFKRMWGAFGNRPVDDDQCPPMPSTKIRDYVGSDQFTTVHTIRVSNDGMVYVADRENRRVQVFTLDGKFINQVVRSSAPFARSLALSRDPDQRFLYVAGGTDLVVVNRKTLEILTIVQADGVLGDAHEMEADSKGNLYMTFTGRGLQKLIFKGISATGR